MKQERKIPGEWSLGRWLLLGAFGIALAVAIALAAGNLADQPVGISGEPVSAGSALEPASDSTGPATTKSTGSGGKQTSPDTTGSPTTSSGSSSGTGTGTYTPPVVPQTQPVPPAVTDGDDSATGTAQPSVSDDSSHGDEKESGDD